MTRRMRQKQHYNFICLTASPLVHECLCHFGTHFLTRQVNLPAIQTVGYTTWTLTFMIHPGDVTCPL